MKKETEERFMKLAKKEMTESDAKKAIIKWTPLYLIEKEFNEKKKEGASSLDAQTTANKVLLENSKA